MAGGPGDIAGADVFRPDVGVDRRTLDEQWDHAQSRNQRLHLFVRWTR